MLVDEVNATIAEYSVKPGPTPNSTIPVEVTDGFRLLGTPVGSEDFSRSFFDSKLLEVKDQCALLHINVLNLQTRLQLFTQCVIQKLPHLLGTDIMHSLPFNYDCDKWEDWNGHLTKSIHQVIKDFIAKLLTQPNIPERSLQILRITIAEGGLGIYDPST